MKLSRRTFFKVNAAGAAALVATPAAAHAATAAAAPDAGGVLVDTTRCIGCRGCEAACAEANRNPDPADDERIFEQRRATDPRAFTVVNRIAAPDGGERFVKTQCMHCVDPACASACPARALEKQPNGAVTYEGSRCLGCRYCMMACPFDVPKFEYDKPVPYVKKCTFCADRQAQGLPPACVEICPSGALTFGTRAELIEEARRRIYQEPGKYVPHVYGEHEAGGTSWLYITDVPVETLPLPHGLRQASYPQLTDTALSAVPVVMTLWPPLLMGLYTFFGRGGHAGGHGDAPVPGGATKEDRHA
ncbi:MAG TPA: 4Fe-4S dicluster domain-containing protein [Vicinamibacterales bacterium]|nr:4Fe-4S dicluster domain-containing protein [Vicinamibacterales bacterium]